MATNRLVSHQFGPGVTLDGTRIEHALRDLVALYNDVPADLVLRRWSPSTLVWGMTPPSTSIVVPWMSEHNGSAGLSTYERPDAEDIQNPYRVKSTRHAVVSPNESNSQVFDVTFAAVHPVVIGAFTVMAEWQKVGPYQNNWTYGAVPPTGKANGDPTEDFTLQVCVSDAWDIENRKKLRQESLVYRIRSDAFLNQIISVAAGVTGMPPHGLLPTHPQLDGAGNPVAFSGFAVANAHPVLVPSGARVHFILTIPKYGAANTSSWSHTMPQIGNVWSLSATCWEATR